MKHSNEVLAILESAGSTSLNLYLREQKREIQMYGKTKAKGGGCDLVGASCGNGGPKTNSMQEFKCFL